VAVFLLLVGFALFKVALGLTVVWLGLRGRPRDEPDDDAGPFDAPEPPPVAPTRRLRSARRRARRPGRDRPPLRRPVRVRA
jgi:hypothetical protein